MDEQDLSDAQWAQQALEERAQLENWFTQRNDEYELYLHQEHINDQPE